MARACRDDLPDGVSEIFFADGLARPRKSAAARSRPEASRARFAGGSGHALSARSHRIFGPRADTLMLIKIVTFLVPLDCRFSHIQSEHEAILQLEIG